MNYCKECKVYINKDLKRCPLCGSHAEPCNECFPEYSHNVQPAVSYPKLKLKGDSHQHFLRKKSPFILSAVILLCLWINIFETPESIWSAYVVIAALFAYFGVIRPIFKKSRTYYILPLEGFLVPIGAYLFDIIYSLSVKGDLSLFGISAKFVAPAVLLALLISTIVLIFTERSKYSYYITSLLLLTLFSAIPQLIMWLTPGIQGAWLSFSTLSFGLISTAIIIIVFRKQASEEIRRKFFI